MVDLEHKLTVDDLIVEYMMYKVKNGYEPRFSTSEFVDFLVFFESRISSEDVLYEKDKLFSRFFELIDGNDWEEVIGLGIDINKIVPQIDGIYDKENVGYLINANYKLSNYDKSRLNTYFLDNGKGKFDNFRGKTFKIRSIIGEYLSSQPKRKIDENVVIDENDLMIGKYVAAEIILNIWDSYVKKLVQHHEWPRQCKDINKYLFEINLAEMIGIESVKDEVLELYSVFSKRVSTLFHQDNSLQMSTYSNPYLARANYDLLIQGYERVMGRAFGDYKKALNIDLSTLTFEESHEIDGIYGWIENPEMKTTTTIVGNDDAKKLVKNLDKNMHDK